MMPSSPPTNDAALRASVVIPAHNEGKVIARLLAALATLTDDGVEVVVVGNGCTDDTIEVARSSGVPAQVIDLAAASKRLALEHGNEVARSFPRVYIDADVIIDAASVLELVEAVEQEGCLAAGPRRDVPRDAASWIVRWYYDVWEQLPSVRTGLFGRGVIALSQDGYARVEAAPALMGDDLLASEAFDPTERAVVDGALVTVLPPRTAADLVRRRVRAATGNKQADRHGVRNVESITSPRTLARIGKVDVRLIPKIAVFLAITTLARWRAWRAVRRGDFDTWLRDESSRS